MPVQETLATDRVPQVAQPPRGPWLWSQQWHDVCFAHWQVPADILRPHLPAALDVDTRQGTAWISVVAFRLHIRRRWLPSLGFCGHFVELNLRTYVRYRDEPGICFLSIHAGKRLAVGLARLLTPLPYVFARIRYQQEATAWHFDCQAAGAPLFDAQFTPTGVSTQAAGDSLDSWLLERYRCFVPGRQGRLYRMVVQHPTWLVQGAAAHVTANKLTAPWGLKVDRPPDALHFAPGLRAWIWPFERVL